MGRDIAGRPPLGRSRVSPNRDSVRPCCFDSESRAPPRRDGTFTVARPRRPYGGISALFAPVPQWIEERAANPTVGGSIPPRRNLLFVCQAVGVGTPRGLPPVDKWGPWTIGMVGVMSDGCKAPGRIQQSVSCGELSCGKSRKSRYLAGFRTIFSSAVKTSRRLGRPVFVPFGRTCVGSPSGSLRVAS